MTKEEVETRIAETKAYLVWLEGYKDTIEQREELEEMKRLIAEPIEF